MDLYNYQNKVFAHRGIHNNKNVPENSLLAFKLAIEKNIPIELDIHLTKDNNLVVFHDDNLKRMTSFDKNIEELTTVEIKQLHLLETNEKIPTLQEVLTLVSGKVLLDIEIKSKKANPLIIDTLLSLLENYKHDVIIKSFNPKIVKLLKKKHSPFLSGLLLAYNTSLWYDFILVKKIIIWYSKPDFLALSKNLLPVKIIQKLIKKYPTLIWTITDSKEIAAINNSHLIYISNISPTKKDI